MGLMRAIAAPERRMLIDASNVPLSKANILAAFTGMPTATGRNISAEGALRIGTVYACVLVLADGVASLPLNLYRRLDPSGKELATSHPLYRILHIRPNPWMTSSTLRSMLMMHLCLWGNAFAEIMRDDIGRVTGLFPLRPDRMQRPVLTAAGGLIYRYQMPSGGYIDMPDVGVLHLRGLSNDGLWGYSPIALQREALGLALTAEEFAARFFGNSAQPGGVLQVKGKLSEPAAENLSRSWRQKHEGLENAHRIAILEEGVEWKQIGMPLQDAQFLELRNYQRSEIAGWFRVPPHMIGDVSRSTSWGTGIEQQAIGFVTYTLRPWLVNIEQQISVDLLSEQDQKVYFAEHLIDGLMRGDSSARGQYYAMMVANGIFSPNDVLALENRNTIEGGDVHMVPLNWTPLDKLGELPPPKDIPGPRALPAPAEQRDAVEDGRIRLRDVFHPLFLDAARHIVERQVANIEDHLKLLDQRNEAAFFNWLKIYQRETLFPEVTDRMTPIVSAYASAVERDVLAELKLASLSENIAPYVVAYVTDLAGLYLGRSEAQLAKVAREAAAASQDIKTALQARLAEWLDTRAGRLADVETVRAGEGAAHETYRRGGVQRLRWQARSKACPFCAHLNGRVVGIDQTFLEAGADFQPEGADAPLRPKYPVRHAPAHRACHCVVRPG